MNINKMIRVASMSTHSRYQHCSIIFAGSRLLTYGYNHGEVHAEIMAINRLEALIRNHMRRPRNLHMINFMIKRKTGKIGNSIPCDGCYLASMNAGIKTITFINSAGKPVQLGGIFGLGEW